jgi:hypothetical protein
MNQGAMNLAFGIPYFNLSADCCRAIGARGGRRRALNLRLRQTAQVPSAPQVDFVPEETAHEASLLLDQRFPHLTRAGCRATRRSRA